MRAALALAVLLAAGPAAGACRLALALGVDVSRSVDAEDYAIQRRGILAALADPAIRDAFLKPEDAVAFAVYEWSGQAYQEVIVDWTLVRSESGLAAIRAVIEAHERGGTALPTGLGAALDYGHALIARAPDCAARTLDISGDGRSNDGRGPEEVYAETDFGDIVVNGLPIGGHEADIAIYYRARVIRGPGAFVEVARDETDYPRAIRRKLERELTEQLMGALGGPDGPG
ncbi:hypothetical protein DEA8626_00565 [Defluviimonas aquaemixtae]|uniref:VWFA domain-containing protein n=1 Tax=Albidovulum aquaemixtae TaxID=1542388 RepID=A0A2R8B321_9RHOB|nr:DUF1194 domain-containing protein [Defluviimonas aquaemixtae]SPH17051.1 hypothetical protein DEA8626_00565 [Defluviimonas aquaemixtae]